MTREEAKEQLWNILFNNFRSEEKDKEALEMAIKALEQHPVLDNIRAEIEQITDTMGVSYNQYVSKIDVLRIIDKYKADKVSDRIKDKEIDR